MAQELRAGHRRFGTWLPDMKQEEGAFNSVAPMPKDVRARSPMRVPTLEDIGRSFARSRLSLGLVEVSFNASLDAFLGRCPDLAHSSRIENLVRHISQYAATQDAVFGLNTGCERGSIRSRRQGDPR